MRALFFQRIIRAQYFLWTIFFSTHINLGRNFNQAIAWFKSNETNSEGKSSVLKKYRPFFVMTVLSSQKKCLSNCHIYNIVQINHFDLISIIPLVFHPVSSWLLFNKFIISTWRIHDFSSVLCQSLLLFSLFQNSNLSFSIDNQWIQRRCLSNFCIFFCCFCFALTLHIPIKHAMLKLLWHFTLCGSFNPDGIEQSRTALS